MRLDMPILNDDFVGSDKEEEDDVIRQGDDIPPQVYLQILKSRITVSVVLAPLFLQPPR